MHLLMYKNAFWLIASLLIGSSLQAAITPDAFADMLEKRGGAHCAIWNFAFAPLSYNNANRVEITNTMYRANGATQDVTFRGTEGIQAHVWSGPGTLLPDRPTVRITWTNTIARRMTVIVHSFLETADINDPPMSSSEYELDAATPTPLNNISSRRTICLYPGAEWNVMQSIQASRDEANADYSLSMQRMVYEKCAIHWALARKNVEG